VKKLAIGCGIVALIVFVVVVGLAVFVGFKARSAVTQFAELGQIPQIESQVRVTSRFSPPASGIVTASQLDRLLQVQKRVHDQLGKNAATFERTYKALADKKQTTIADMPALMSAYRDIAAMWLDAKRTQVAALNDAGLSLEEYRWVRSAAYQAIGAPFMEIDFGQMASAVKSGMQPATAANMEGAFHGPAPDANLKLVAPFRKPLEDNLALASLGL
jgi:hypothetical protein